jgi:ubiquinone/menaquinone biosynthesis C-methylase UbiE
MRHVLATDDINPPKHVIGPYLRRRSMANTIDMGVHLAGQSLRIGWYYGVGMLADRAAGRIDRPHYKPSKPLPSRWELLMDLGALVLADAAAVRDGVYPPLGDEPGSPVEHVSRLRQMLADLPTVLHRRDAQDAGSAKAVPGAEGLPEYFTQDFHFQTGGYLTAKSARLYDLQVETLFMGAAGPMRRAALRPIAAFMHGRDQRQASLLDVACGTGRFVRHVRRAYPALAITGLDLSRTYLEEARRHLKGLRPVNLLAGNAEEIPLPAASQDIITSIFLFHELPPTVRRKVVAEIARVLKPGGIFVLIDSLQLGDKPGWDGLLEAFPFRFHEPYYRHYTTDNLDLMLSKAGLAADETSLVYLSKMMVRKKK